MQVFPKKLACFRIISYLCSRTMDVFHYLGMGCPRSEELSGSWRLFFHGNTFCPQMFLMLSV